MLISMRLRLICILLGVLNHGVWATELPLEPIELAYLDDNPTLKLCVDPDWMPYEKLDENGRHIGLVANYLSLFESRLDIKFEVLKTASWQETQGLYQEQKCDVVSALNKTQKRSQYLEFTQPYITSPAVLVVNEKVPGIKKLSDLSGKTLAMVEGYVYEEKLREHHPEIAFEHVPNMEAAMVRVSNEDVVATIGPLFLTFALMQEGQIKHLKMIGETGYRDELRIGVPKGRVTLRSIFDKVIANLSQADHALVRTNWSKSRK